MKKLIIICTGLLMCLAASAQNNIVTEFQKKFGKDVNFTNISISKKMFEMTATLMEDDMQEAEFFRDITGLKLIMTEKPDAKFMQEATRLIERSGLEELMNVQDQADNVLMYVREKNGLIHELVIAIQDTSEFMLMTITGKIDLKKISSLGKINGLEGVFSGNDQIEVNYR